MLLALIEHGIEAQSLNQQRFLRRLMPQIEHWDNVPEGCGSIFVERMRDRDRTKRNTPTPTAGCQARSPLLTTEAEDVERCQSKAGAGRFRHTEFVARFW